MPTDLTNFQKDLADPGTVDSSELYRAVKPFTDVESYGKPQTAYDVQRLGKLKEDVRRGVVGLEYLTGLKNNEVETFYDAHPAQALASNALSNSGKLGLAAAVGIPAANIYRQYKNLKETEHAYHARRNDPVQMAENRLYPQPKKNGDPGFLEEDIGRVFGSPDPSDVEGFNKRTKILDMLSPGAVPEKKPGKALLSAIKEFEAMPEGAEKTEKFNDIKKQMQALKVSPASRDLRDYVDLHKDLTELKAKGYNLKGDILGGLGDNIHESLENYKLNVATKNPRLAGLIDSAIPTSSQGLEDLIRKRIVDKNPGAYNEQLVQEILADTHGIDFTGSSPEAKRLKATLFSRLQHGKNTGNTMNRLLRSFGPSLALGAGVTGAGLGLHKLLSMLQSKAYGDEKIKEWKRNSLKAQGDFEKAESIK
jgi:hypothetical protein